MAIQSVAVIGAGISGLVTADALQMRGYDVTVFEKEVSIGKSWGRSIFYIGEVAQTVRKDYTFYGTGLPRLSGEWSDGEEMQQYLQAYALVTKVQQLISFQTNVQKVNFDTNGWTISAQQYNDNQYKYIEKRFNAVVVCTGFETGSYYASGTAIRFTGNQINTMFYGREHWYLHRNIAVADGGGIGFVGIHGGLYFTLTATIAAHWMAAHLSGQVPSSSHQLITKKVYKRCNKKSQLSQLIHYLNQLLKDMGSKPLASSNPLMRIIGASFEPEIYAIAPNKLISKPDPTLYNISADKYLKSAVHETNDG